MLKQTKTFPPPAEELPQDTAATLEAQQNFCTER